MKITCQCEEDFFLISGKDYFKTREVKW